MAIEVKIPPMGESITSGVLAKWHVTDGAIVKKDQPLFELETDKITSEGTAEVAGQITFKVAAGTEVKIGQVVATIDESAATAASAPAVPIENQKSKIENPATQSPAVRRLAAETGIDPAVRRRHRQGRPRHQGRHARRRRAAAGGPGLARAATASAPAPQALSAPRLPAIARPARR
jgi:2-oxoglutarate dehydrogenase E2 component (dihydrolipoamide succinyltransferase)